MLCCHKLGAHMTHQCLIIDNKAGAYSQWSGLLNNMVEHFLKIADKVIIFGAHPNVDGTLPLQPSIVSKKEIFLGKLDKLEITNIRELNQASSFFDEYDDNKNTDSNTIKDYNNENIGNNEQYIQ